MSTSETPIAIDYRASAVAASGSPAVATPRLVVMRAVELVAFLVVPPLIYTLGIWRPPLLLAVMAMGLIALALLLTDPTFDRRQLWRRSGLHAELRHVVWLFAIGAALFIALLAIFMPERLFELPRTKTGLWLMIMFGYPIASVYPQELIYRAYFFHRYQVLFRRPWIMVVASAVLFGYAHILFQHWIPVVATLVGGLIFAWRYERRRSLAVAFVEHSLYGQMIFTIGLGHFFYHGTMRAMQTLSQ